MQARYIMVLAMIASFGFVAFLAQAAYAQTTRPAYFVAVFDAASEQEIRETDHPSLVPATFQQFGGRYVIQSPRTIPFDVQPPMRIVVIEFESMEKLQAWHASEAFRSFYDPHKAAKVRAFAVEGFAQGAD